MANLSIDYDELNRARIDIDDVLSSFSNADKVSSDIGGLVGHSGLASKVEEFSDSWDINRDKLKESLSFISESLTAIIDTFTELDAAQAKALSSTEGP